MQAEGKIPRRTIDKSGLQWLTDATLLKSRDLKPGRITSDTVTKSAQLFL